MECVAKRNRRKLFSLAVILGSFSIGTVQSATLQVDNVSLLCSDSVGEPFCSLHAAIEQAAIGDTIQVAAGFYTGGISLSKNLNIIGAGSEQTVLDGGGSGTVVEVVTHVTASLQGLSIVNGMADDGGGIHNGGKLTLKDCEIANNVAHYHGGGIYNSGHAGAHLEVANCQIHNNQALGDDSFNIRYGGGGIYNRGLLSITQSEIHHNLSAESGGGLFTLHKAALAEAAVRVIDSTFHHNQADFGAAINSHGTLTVLNSEITANQATRSDRSSGGGIFVHHDAAVLLDTVTISDNTASVRGAGVRFYSMQESQLKNVSITNNRLQQNRQGAGLYVLQQTQPLTLEQSTIKQNWDSDLHLSNCAGPLRSLGGNSIEAEGSVCQIENAETDPLNQG